MNRPLVGTLLVASALGGPYLVFETPIVNSISGWSEATEQTDYATTGEAPVHSGMPTAGLNGQPGSELTQSLQALSEVVRFDVNPSWVMQRFPRISTVLSNLQLDGMRVPLVTGTQPTDLAGTLTYYFDRYQRVQRVTLHGVTGDPSRFLAELQHAYQLEQQPQLGGGLYLKNWNGRPTSVVYFAPAAVISSQDPYARYQFFAELNQPGLEFGMSQEAQQLLTARMASGRSTW